MRGALLIDSLQDAFGANTDDQLARQLGVTSSMISQWRNQKQKLSVRQVSGLVQKARNAGAQHIKANAIKPVVEFFPINVSQTSKGAKRKLFSEANADGDGQHKYRAGLLIELKAKTGVYIFFDSRGQAIYTGKAKKQTLWNEMTDAFNRNRRTVQTIKRVAHPTLNQEYKTSEEQARQIVDHTVCLYELAHYFSAYEIEDDMIDEIEAMLVRSFANDLLNIRMEKFGKQRRKTSE